MYTNNVKISATYRLIASLLSLSILVGVSLPAGLHLKSMEACDVMEGGHSNHKMPITMMAGHDECPMADQHQSKAEHISIMEAGMHDFGFACACSVDEAPVKTEAPVYKKVKTQILAVVEILAEDHSNQTESAFTAIQTSDSYSPPPIFLVNESFII